MTAGRRVWALVPLKDLSRAKTRLAQALGPEGRRELALTMARDVVRALTQARSLERVVVVSDIPRILTLLETPGLDGFDPPGTGLNEDLTAAAEWAAAQGATHVLTVHADLPLLTAPAVDAFMESRLAANDSGLRAAACKEGTGTNLLLAPLPLPLPLVFGRGSLGRFEASARERQISFDIRHDPDLSADIDELEDLRALEALCQAGHCRGKATAELLIRLASAHSPAP